MPRYAAIDIGSNSLRMEAAEATDGSPTKILATAREVTRLGESVFRTGRISPESIALVCGISRTCRRHTKSSTSTPFAP